MTRANPDTHHWLVRHYSHKQNPQKKGPPLRSMYRALVCGLSGVCPRLHMANCRRISVLMQRYVHDDPFLFFRRSRHSLRTLTTPASRTQPPQNVFLHAVYSALLSCFREQASTVGQPGEERLRGRKVCRALTDLPKGPTLRTHGVELAHPAS